MGIRRLWLFVTTGLTIVITALMTACSRSEGVAVDRSTGDFQAVLESSVRFA